jgi:tRNA-dihydrouridine synthase
MVAKKGRGSGLLPYPDKIEEFLAATVPAMPTALSIKLRLGRKNADEIFRLLPILNRYPLEELVIHPRTGIQMYEGDIDLDTFEKCLTLSKHPITYNGDITTLNDFNQLSKRFTGIKSWMIGRGVITNPFLPAIIKTGCDPFENKIETMHRFHDDLYSGYLEIFQGPSHLVQRMKGFWKYFALSFEDSRKIQKKIFKAKTGRQYESVVKHFFESEAQWRLTPVKRLG